MKRAHELGLSLGGIPGPLNHLCDVPGVSVGHEQVIKQRSSGKIDLRTGVSVIFPQPRDAQSFRVPAGVHVFNGNGEMTGLHFIEEKGMLEGPVALTGTFSVGLVSQALRKWMRQRYPDHEHDDIFMGLPVVAETYDGFLHAIDEEALTEAHVFSALEKASPHDLREGDIGGGTGMMSFGFKSGIGSASRRVECRGHHFTLGALVQANFGKREDLQISGRPVGREWEKNWLPNFQKNKDGSLIVVIATDALLSPRQLKSLAKRASLGMAEMGSVGRHSSGDLFLAFSTTRPQTRENGWEEWITPPDAVLDAFFAAAKFATHEAILNSLLASRSLSTGERQICSLRDTGYFK